MSSDNMQDYLNKGIYGANQTKPEERQEYLGSLRERIYLSMTLEQLISTDYLDALKKEITKYPGNTLLFNGSVDIKDLNPYIKLSKQLNCSFRIVTDEDAENCNIGLIYIAPQAVNNEIINVAEKYPAADEDPEKEKHEKKSFFKKLFS
ncbi:YueI family protein [Carnobacterium funditum]|uniref:YueI family protein n=1 Tax=Carnobacterium funditum TaxID=2752 RepID=UPI000552FEE2|nr:YueI family protein [Carnobacterium funditum]